ncbi:MAG TPA: SAM-dependent methyltransferase [Actinophytocola sp.]|uniref:SAM-dependent methyltransferase n=1 Tax=Actinophytocola sp. TaxID=1872138 RepID=UPI002E05CA11|nr:SAM-dependent methyltransferase [Actinophytocola sp.]
MEISGVSRTAIGVAWLRAQERLRPDKLFDDPYAADFVMGAREMMAEAASRSGERGRAVGALFGKHVVIRTKFYDDYLLSACAAGCRQVVLVAAGLDTRAFRLDWPAGVRLFELDLPDLLDYKERILDAREAAPRCERTVLAVDLREDWAGRLVEAGLRPTEPTAWLIEGLLVYLGYEEAAGLLTAIGSLSAPGSQLSCEDRNSASESLATRVREAPELAEVVALWKGGLGTDLGDWLTRDGWQVRGHNGTALAGTYGRADAEAAYVGFLTAVRDGSAERTS